MACACSAMTTLDTQTVKTEQINNFLGMTSKETYWPQPTVTDEGVRENSNWASLAATAVAIASTITSVSIANKQYELAKDYYKMAKEKWDRFKTVYMPCERKELAEACGTPEYDPRYDEEGSAYSGNVKYAYGQAQTALNRLNKLYCICPDPTLAKDIALMQTTSVGDAVNYVYRREEARKEAQDDRRWNRRSQSLNRGRDIQAQMISYAKAAAGAYGDLGETVGRAATGAISAIGYFNNRNDTVYPRRTPLQIPGGAAVGAGFVGVDNVGWTSPTPLQVGTGNELDPNIAGYNNLYTTYNSNNAIGSAIGSQQNQTSGA